MFERDSARLQACPTSRRNAARPWLTNSLIAGSLLAGVAVLGTSAQASAAQGSDDAALESTEAEIKESAIKPPRVDGAFINVTPIGVMDFARITDFREQGPYFGGGALIRAGQAVYPWLSLGLTFNLAFTTTDAAQLQHFSLLAEFDFYPKPGVPFSIRVGAGAGGGRGTEPDREDRPGLFGAAFITALRYEFFPGANKRRPNRAGGFAIGPELGWMGYTPASKGESMINGIYLGLSIGPYFGN